MGLRAEPALDEIGATIGPLIIALVLMLRGNFRTGYAFLTISAAAALVALVVARVNFPLPSRLEQGHTAPARLSAEPNGCTCWPAPFSPPG